VADVIAPATPTSFTMSDGVQTINTANSVTSIFQFSTDSSGKIAEWDILSQSVSGQIASALIVSAADSGQVFATGFGQNNNSPGTWTVSQTPLPAALPLFATGLGAMGLFGWARSGKLPLLSQPPDYLHARGGASRSRPSVLPPQQCQSAQNLHG
jgi:hypothetical protein